MKASLYNVNAFDGNTEQEFNFVWTGNQSFGNILQIRDNISNIIIYEERQTTMQLKHFLPATTLNNGDLYNARVAVIDIDGNVSEYSDPILFYCFTSPVFTFNNIEQNQVIKNSSYQVIMSYSQLEGERLQGWDISLYDVGKNIIQTSKVCYTDDISYTLMNLEDNQTYYIRATCSTINGMIVDTGYISISVNYTQPSVYSILTLENVQKNGYIKLQSNVRAVKAKSEKDAQYINDDYVDLKDNTVFIDDDFSLDDNFIINLLGYDITPNTLIMQLSDGIHTINLYLRKGIYDINHNIEKTFIELNIPTAFTSYVCFSNYIDNPSNTDILDIWLKKKNGLYVVYITNKGGQ